MKNLYHFLLGTLRGRLIIGVAAVHAVMMALFVGDLTVRQRTMLLDRQIEGAAALSQALATSAAGWIAANDISGLQELVEAQRRYPEILFVILANEEGRVLAGSDKSRQGLYMLDLPREARQTVFSRTPALVDIAVPAMIGGRHVGWARVGIGQTAADQKLAEITQNGVVYALAAILIGSVIAWFMGRWITRRLYAVQRTIDAVRSGNRLARSSLAGTDEAAVMAQEFNSMLDALAAQDEKLSAGEKRYRSLIYKVQTAIVLHDGQGRVLNSNPLAQELLGLSTDQLLGKSLIDPEWHFLREDGSVLPVAEYPVSLVLSTRQPLRGHVTGIICPDRHHVAWVLVNAEPEYDDAGEIALVIVSFVDITERKRAEQERLSNLRFFERMDRVNRAIQGARDVHSMMSDVLDVALSIFDCDRAWLFYPCDPDARSFRVPMEITKPEYPGAKILNVDLPMPPDMAQNLREALESVGPVTYTAGTGKPINKVSADQFGVKSMMMVALYPKSGKPWAFGLHQCSYPRVWTSEEERLFQETGRRLADALTGLLMQRDLQESENRYRRIAEGLTDYQYSVRIEHDRPVETTQSPTCAIVTGYTPEEFAADPYLWINMIPPDDRALVRERIQQILGGNEIPPIEHRICRKDGKTCWVSDTIILFKDASGKLLSYDGVIKDITERKLAEEKLHRLNRELRAVGNCNQVLVRAEDEQTLLNNICRIICDEAGYRMAWVGYAENDEAKTIRPVAWAGAEDGYLEQARLTWADTERGRGTSGTAIRSGESTCIQDFTSDPRAVPWRDSALQRGYRSGIALPLKDESEKTFGVLNIYSTEPNAFTPDEIRLLEELAGDLAFGIMVLRARIERRRVENIMQARLRLLEFAGSHSMDELLTATLDEIEALTGSAIGFYHFVESDQETLSLQSWSTNTLKNMCTAEGKGSHYDIDQAGAWVDCVHERRPVIHNDYDSLPHRKGMPEGHAPVIREVVVPIYRGTQIRAIIGVGNKSANYVPSDIEIVSQLGDLSWDITERKRAEEALYEAQLVFRTLVENSPDIIARYDRDCRRTYVNPTYLKAAQIPQQQLLLIAPPQRSPLPAASAAVLQNLLHRVLAGGVPEAVDVIWPKADNIDYWYNIYAFPEFDREGRVVSVMTISRDITERKRMEQALTIREQEYRTLLEHIPDLIVRYDTDLRRIYVNPAWEKLAGLSAEDVIDKHMDDIPYVPVPTVSEYVKKLKEVFKTGTAQSIAFSWINAYKETLYLEYEIIPEYDEYENIVSVLAIGHDLTERKQAEEELKQYRTHLEDLVRDRTEELEKKTQQLETANIRLREADRLKSVFLASMSHELRTPLNSIIGFTGIMLMGMAGDLNEEQRRQLAMVKSSANHLLGLINDVLDIAKIEAGRVTLSRECFKLEDVVDSVFETLLPMATEKGLELVRDIQSEIALVSDKRRIKQILINIAGNAITFTDRGHVRISARALGEDKLELRFTDTGIGIRQEDINRLFSPFQQIDMSLTKAHEGTGLGLYLCKRLAILLGGDVGVTSTYGQGSEFTVVLPMTHGGADEKDTDR